VYVTGDIQHSAATYQSTSQAKPATPYLRAMYDSENQKQLKESFHDLSNIDNKMLKPSQISVNEGQH